MLFIFLLSLIVFSSYQTVDASVPGRKGRGRGGALCPRDGGGSAGPRGGAGRGRGAGAGRGAGSPADDIENRLFTPEGKLTPTGLVPSEIFKLYYSPKKTIWLSAQFLRDDTKPGILFHGEILDTLKTLDHSPLLMDPRVSVKTCRKTSDRIRANRKESGMRADSATTDDLLHGFTPDFMLAALHFGACYNSKDTKGNDTLMVVTDMVTHFGISPLADHYATRAGSRVQHPKLCLIFAKDPDAENSYGKLYHAMIHEEAIRGHGSPVAAEAYISEADHKLHFIARPDDEGRVDFDLGEL